MQRYPMRSDWLGVPDVVFATSFARTSTSTEVLAMMLLGGGDVDASDVNVVANFAEAPTSLRRDAVMREMGGCWGMGRRFWMRTSLPRTPGTHRHTGVRKLTFQHLAGGTT